MTQTPPFTTINDIGDGPIRSVRRTLEVTAFGVNALVIPPGASGMHHFHDEQDELYFVHAGTASFDVDGTVQQLTAGGLCHVTSTTPRKFTNVGDDDLVLLVVGGKNGYVGRDGQLVNS